MYVVQKGAVHGRDCGAQVVPQAVEPVATFDAAWTWPLMVVYWKHVRGIVCRPAWLLGFAALYATHVIVHGDH